MENALPLEGGEGEGGMLGRSFGSFETLDRHGNTDNEGTDRDRYSGTDRDRDGHTGADTDRSRVVDRKKGRQKDREREREREKERADELVLTARLDSYKAYSSKFLRMRLKEKM
ncbi:hypothetical protein B484DRAFT_398208 [Ochromonadaceae sp. CCMP2298]|nr:hypothetical protein B484DRAFT_398208 [Ochromonadaceae sp. CCMP2298]